MVLSIPLWLRVVIRLVSRYRARLPKVISGEKKSVNGRRPKARGRRDVRYDQAVDTVLLFANPIAGRGRGKRIAAALRRRLAEEGYCVTASLDRPDVVADGDLPLQPSPPRAAIAVGGDGTLRGVAQRLADRYGLESMPPLLVVPIGTANLMGKHLGVDWRDKTMAEQVAVAVSRRRLVHLDAAQLNGKL